MCRVKGCKYNTFHVTRKHICSECLFSGHGKQECCDTNMILELRNYDDEILSEHCTVEKCTDNTTHTTEGHMCIFCSKYGNNHMKKCPIDGTKIVDSTLETQSVSNLDEEELSSFSRTVAQLDYELKAGEYTHKYIGMNCYEYFRRNKETNMIETLYMPPNNWGDDDTSDLPRYKAFIHEYTRKN